MMYVQHMPTEYTSLRLRADVAENMRRLIRRVSFDGDRDIPQSDVMGAALELAARHYDELTAALGIAATEGATPDESHGSRRE